MLVLVLVVCLLSQADGDKGVSLQVDRNVGDPLLPYEHGGRGLRKREAAESWMESILSLVPGLGNTEKSRASKSQGIHSDVTHQSSSHASEHQTSHVHQPSEINRVHQPNEVHHASEVHHHHTHKPVPPETNRSYRGRPVPLTGRGKHNYGPNVKPAVQLDNVSELTKLLGGILPNTYYSRPKYRYPYYEQSGKGYLLYGYGDRDLYEYSVFKPLEGYF